MKTNEGLDIVAGSLDEAKEGMKVLVAVRPENIEVKPHGFAHRKRNTVSGVVEGIEYLGDLSRYSVKTEYQIINADQFRPSIKDSFELGEKVTLSFERENVDLIDIL